MNLSHFRLSVGSAAAVSCAVLLTATPALADTVESPIGRLTAEQYLGEYCDDSGAHVRVTVAAGLPNTTYTAVGTGFWQPTARLLTDAAGAGWVDLHNVETADGGWDGTAIVKISTAATTVEVPATIYCRSHGND